MRVLFNEALDNMQKRGWNMKAIDSDIFTDQGLLNWRPDGVIPVDVPANKNLQTAILELKTEDNSASVERLITFCDNFLGQKSGITPGAQGQASDDKVRIYLGNQQEVADRIDFVSKMYRECHAKIGLRFVNGLKQNLNEAYAVKLIGTNGVEWDKLRKEEIGEFDITIIGGTQELQINEAKKMKQSQILDSIAISPELMAKVNKNWFLEMKLKQADFTDADIKTALDVNNDGDQEILSEAAQAIQDILHGIAPDMNRGATTRFIQKIIDFAIDSDIDEHVYNILMDYAEQHIPIAKENADRKARKLIEANVINGMMPGQMTAPAQQAQEPIPAEPNQMPAITQ
jgi:hypothetical protein